jgi:CshA-type fibril repeat protein
MRVSGGLALAALVIGVLLGGVLLGGGPLVATAPAQAVRLTAGTLALTSSGDDEQWTTIPVPPGGWVALLDANREPVTATTFRGQGTYTLDPATGEISFQPRRMFYGTARAATFQLTDANGQAVTGTYTATVLPRAIPSIRAADRTLTSAGISTARIGCTAGPVPLSRCEASLSAVVNGETVMLASGSAAAPGQGGPAAGRIGTLNLDLTLTERGKRLAGAPGGWPVDVTVSLWLPGVAEPLQATGTTRLTALNVTAPRPILYDAGAAAIPDGDLPYLNALRSRMSDVTTVTCTGGNDGQGSPDAVERVARERAQRVCDYLTANTTAHAVVLTSEQPGTNGLASARRTEIVFGYTPAGGP